MPLQLVVVARTHLRLNPPPPWAACRSRRNWGDNQLTGPLPVYVNGMTTFTLVGLQNNQFTGALRRAHSPD